MSTPVLLVNSKTRENCGGWVEGCNFVWIFVPASQLYSFPLPSSRCVYRRVIAVMCHVVCVCVFVDV